MNYKQFTWFSINIHHAIIIKLISMQIISYNMIFLFMQYTYVSNSYIQHILMHHTFNTWWIFVISKSYCIQFSWISTQCYHIYCIKLNWIITSVLQMKFLVQNLVHYAVVESFWNANGCIECEDVHFAV